MLHKAVVMLLMSSIVRVISCSDNGLNCGFLAVKEIYSSLFFVFIFTSYKSGVFSQDLRKFCNFVAFCFRSLNRPNDGENVYDRYVIPILVITTSSDALIISISYFLIS